MQMTGLNWTTDCIASLPSVFVADRQDKHAHHCSRLAAAALLYVRLLPVNAQSGMNWQKRRQKLKRMAIIAITTRGGNNSHLRKSFAKLLYKQQSARRSSASETYTLLKRDRAYNKAVPSSICRAWFCFEKLFQTAASVGHQGRHSYRSGSICWECCCCCCCWTSAPHQLN